MRRLRAVLATISLVSAGVPVVARAATPPDCSLMTATPSGSPLVVWCAATVPSPATGRVERVRLWRTTGNGRWAEAKAANLVVADVPAPPQVSPRWAHDRTLYWSTSAGLFASVDLGESFRLVSPLVTGSEHPVRRMLLTDAGGTVRATVAGYDPHDIGWSDSGGVTTPVTGSPDDDLVAVPSPDGVGMLAWDVVTTAPHRVVGYECTVLLFCAAPWFSLPVPTDGWAQQLAGVWRPRAATTTEPTYLAVREGRDFARVTLWRVVRGGAVRLPGAGALVERLTDGRNAPLVTVAFSGTAVVLRVVSWADRAGSAHDRLYVSTDRGASWRALAGGATDTRGRVTGTSAWRPGAVSLSFVPAVEVRDDVWLVNVSDGTRYTLRCSRDRGRRWRASCS